MNQNFLHLNHKTLQKVKDQQSFQDSTDFGSWVSIILKILTVFGEKMAKIKKFNFLTMGQLVKI